MMDPATTSCAVKDGWKRFWRSVSRLQKATGAAIMLAFAERRPGGQGYDFHLQRMQTAGLNEARLNRAIESLVRHCPAQYLWGYNRYKVPAGVQGPEMSTEER